MPFCHHCGAETLTGAIYCSSCGSAISIAAAITTQVPSLADESGPQKAKSKREPSPVAITTHIPVIAPESGPQKAKTIREASLAAVTMQVPQVAYEPRSPNAKSIKNTFDSLAEKLRIKKIAQFSLKDFFSEVLGRHEPDAAERLLSVGTPDNTPKVEASMSAMPHPWIFFRILCGAIITYLILLLAWKASHNVNLLAGLLIIGSFAVPFSVMMLFFELNSTKNISMLKVVQLAVAGGAVSLLMSAFFIEAAPFLGNFGAPAAAIVEEIGKLAALLVAMQTVKFDRYRHRLNGLLAGAALGAGFTVFEAAGYALRSGLLVNAEAMLDNGLRLGVLSLFSHIPWTAIAASAFWICRPRHRNTWDTLRSALFLKLFAIPVVLHFIWNLPFHGPLMIKNLALGLVAWAVIIGLVQYGLEELQEC